MKKTPLHRWTPLAVAVTVALNPTLVAGQVVSAGGAVVTNAPNGVPVVNIVAPNSAGLSHNKYGQFNVDSRGLVLNNSTQPVITQIGGGIRENANLGGNAARIILNEVVQSNRSTLAGFIEVGGARAEVVLANPAGITCNGCGFINTPRATLTTGTPNIDGTGNLTGFAVRGGDISITGAGLDATQADYFSILARAVSVTGPINARELLVAGGAHDFDYGARSVTAAAAGGAPAVGIDSSLLGGMYADRIRLVVTEAGVGVRLLGEAGASAGDMTLSASGLVELRNQVTAQGNLSIAGNGLDASNSVVVASGNLALAAGSGALTLAGGKIGADGNSSFSGATLTDTGGTGAIRYADGILTLNVAGAANVSNAEWNGMAALNVTAGSLTAGGSTTQFTSSDTSIPSGSVSITTSGNLALGTAQVAALTSLALAGSNVSLGGQVESGGALSVNASGTFTNNGTVSAGGTLTLGGNAVTNNASLVGDILAVNVASLTNAGTLQAQNGGSVTAATLTNNSGKTIASMASGADLTVTSNALANAGTIQSAGDLSIATKGTLSNTGTLVAADALSVALRTPASDTLVLNNSGKVEAGGLLSILGRNAVTRAMTINNQADGTLKGGTLNLRADLLDNFGTVRADTTGSIDAAKIVNENATSAIAFAGATGTSTITAGGLQGLDNRGLILSGADLAINTQKFNNSDTSAVYADGNLTIASTGSLYNIGFLGSGGNMALSGTAVTNDLVIGGGTGEIGAIGAVAITGTSSVTNRGYIDAYGDITITTPVFVNETVRPDVVADTELHLVPGTRQYIAYNFNDAKKLLPSGEFWLNNQPIDHQIQRGTIRLAFVRVGLIHDGVPYTPANGGGSTCTFTTFQCGDLYTLEYQSNDDYFPGPVDPIKREPPFDWYNQMFRNYTAQVYSGSKFATDPSATQARIVTSHKLTINAASITNTGARLEASENMFINPYAAGGSGSFNNLDLTLMQTVYQALGREKWSVEEIDSQSGLRSMDNHYLLAEIDALVIDNPAGVPALVNMLGGIVRAGGQVRFAPGMSVVNGSRPVLQSQNNFFVNVQGNPGGGSVTPATPGGPVAVPGLNLTLPVNPNGLFIVNPNPRAKYLVESNPLYASLESAALGSDYLVQRLGLNPDTVMQRLGDPRYENHLVQQQIIAQTGERLLQAVATRDEQMKKLMDNAVWAAAEQGLGWGVALTKEQINALKQDIVWMVETTVAGHRVLAPVVYLASASRAVTQESRIVADKIVVADAQSFVNTGTVRGTTEVSVRSSGDILNAGGSIEGGRSVSLTSTEGSVTNASTVFRAGDADNHSDSMRTARIATTNPNGGDVKIDAKQDVNLVGDSVSSTGWGQISIKAGRDVNQKDIITETKKTTVKSWDGGMFGSSHTEIAIDVDQTSRGSNVRAGGNVKIEAGRNYTATGSAATGRGNATATAQNILMQDSKATDSTYRYSSSSGFNDRGGYSSSSSESTTTTTTATGSSFGGGGNTVMTGRDSITLVGSDVSAGNNLTRNTRSLTEREARETRVTTSRSESLDIGATGSANSNKTEGGIAGSRTTTSSNESIDVARVSTVRAGVNVTDNVQGGSISRTGTQITAGGDVTQNAATIEMRAAENRYSSDSSSRTTGGGITAGVYYNAGTAVDQASQGQKPGVGLPSAMVGVTGSESNSSSSASGTQAVTSNIAARGNVISNSTGRTLIEGSQIQAGNQVQIRAGELDVRAARNTANSSSSSDSRSGGAQGGVDAMGKPTGGAQGAYSDSNSSSSSSTAVVSNIRSNAGTTIVTTGDAKFEGTNLQSGGATSVTAGGSVQFNAAVDTASSSGSSQSYAGSAGQDQSGQGGNKQGSGSFQRGNSSSSSTTERAGSITSQGGITVAAGKEGDVVMRGTNAASERGNVTVTAGRDVKLEATRSTSTSDSTSYGGSASGSAGGKDKKSDDGKGGGEGSVSGNYSSSNSSSTTETGGSLQGRNITITSGRDTSMTGTQVDASRTATVNAGGALTMQSAQSSSSSSGMSVSGSASGQQGTSKTGKDGKDQNDAGGGSASGSFGMSNSSSTTNQNASISGSRVQINTGGDMTMQGANVSGNEVQANVGGNLKIESRASTSSSSSTNVGGYVGGDAPSDGSSDSVMGKIGSATRAGASGSFANQSGSSTTIQRSGIQGGDVTVNVMTGNTSLQAGVIAGSEQTTLNTRSLTQSGMEANSASSSISGGAGMRLTAPAAPGGSSSSNSSSSTVNSQVGAAGRQVQATLNVAQMSTVLNQPAVQTALQLNKGMKAAVDFFGGADKVPADAMLKVLASAGVPVPAGADAAALKIVFNSALESGHAAATTALARTGIPPAQADGILRAIVP